MLQDERCEPFVRGCQLQHVGRIMNRVGGHRFVMVFQEPSNRRIRRFAIMGSDRQRHQRRQGGPGLKPSVHS